MICTFFLFIYVQKYNFYCIVLKYQMMFASRRCYITSNLEQVLKIMLFQIDNVYYISKCQIKPANKQFSTLKNDYEMATTNDTVIEECHDDDLASLQTQYKFVDISKIAELEPNQTIGELLIYVCN